jgi:hypothetical protein
METDWELAFGAQPFSEGCQSPHGHLFIVSLPKRIPERIGIATYIMEYMFHHDDMCIGSTKSVIKLIMSRHYRFEHI